MDRYSNLCSESNNESEEGDKNVEKRQSSEKLKERLDSYLNEFLELSFNSGNYDINSAKKSSFAYLVKTEQVQFVIKRNNNHMCL